MSQMSTKVRLDYLDNLKSYLMCLVIIHHVAIVYGGEGLFIISASTEGTTVFNLIMTAILAINQSYFMGLFFAISAYFSYRSLVKRGYKSFIIGKFKRLFIPAMVYLLIVSPVLSAVIDMFYLNISFRDLEARFNIGALWFLIALFIFDIVLALLYKPHKCLKRMQLPNAYKVILWLLIITISSWVIRCIYPVGRTVPILAFQVSHFPQYIVAYIIGVQASKQNWLKIFDCKRYIKVLWLIIPTLIIFLGSIGVVIDLTGSIDDAFGGYNVVSFLYCLWEQIMFFIMLYGLVSLFMRYLNYKNKLFKIMSRSAFLAYIAHSSVIVFLVIALSKIEVSHLQSFWITILFSIVGSFTLGNLLRKVIKL